MSDPYIVVAIVDDAPWDSDSESRVKVYEFSGPEEARLFYERLSEWAKEQDTDLVTIITYEPEPVIRIANAEDAMQDFMDDDPGMVYD